MNVRVGIHIKDIVIDDGDVYGDEVNLESRLERLSRYMCFKCGL